MHEHKNGMKQCHELCHLPQCLHSNRLQAVRNVNWLTTVSFFLTAGEPEEPSRPDFLARALGKDGSLWTSRLKPIDGRSNWDSEATLLAALHLPNLTDLTMGRCGIGSWALVGLESKIRHSHAEHQTSLTSKA